MEPIEMPDDDEEAMGMHAPGSHPWAGGLSVEPPQGESLAQVMQPMQIPYPLAVRADWNVIDALNLNEPDLNGQPWAVFARNRTTYKDKKYKEPENTLFAEAAWRILKEHLADTGEESSSRYSRLVQTFHAAEKSFAVFTYIYCTQREPVRAASPRAKSPRTMRADYPEHVVPLTIQGGGTAFALPVGHPDYYETIDSVRYQNGIWKATASEFAVVGREPAFGGMCLQRARWRADTFPRKDKKADALFSDGDCRLIHMMKLVPRNEEEQASASSSTALANVSPPPSSRRELKQEAEDACFAAFATSFTRLYIDQTSTSERKQARGAINLLLSSPFVTDDVERERMQARLFAYPRFMGDDAHNLMHEIFWEPDLQDEFAAHLGGL